jgi:hypothetical protein
MSSSLQIIENGDLNDEFVGNVLKTSTFRLDSGNNNVSFDHEFIPTYKSTYYLRLFNSGAPSPQVTGNITVNSVDLFLLTQSVAPSSSLCLDVFLEPYVTQNNYYNSDFNPLMNNVMENRKNTILPRC